MKMEAYTSKQIDTFLRKIKHSFISLKVKVIGQQISVAVSVMDTKLRGLGFVLGQI